MNHAKKEVTYVAGYRDGEVSNLRTSIATPHSHADLPINFTEFPTACLASPSKFKLVETLPSGQT